MHHHRFFVLLMLCVVFTELGKAQDSSSGSDSVASSSSASSASNSAAASSVDSASSSSDSAASSSSDSAASSSSDSAVSSSSDSAASSSSDSAASSFSDSAASSSSDSAASSFSDLAASSSSDSAASSSSDSAASSSSDSAASSSSDSAASSSSDSDSPDSDSSYDDSSDDDEYYDDYYDEYYFDDSYYDMITTLDSPAPNVPLMFSTPYLTAYGSRSLLSEAQLPGIAVAINATTSVLARVQLWASSEASVVTLQGQMCTSYTDYANDTISTREHYGCDDMVLCNEVTEIAVAAATTAVSSSFTSTLLVATPSTTAATSSSDDTCTSGVLTTVLTTSAPILSKPQSAYVALAYNLSALSNESASAASAIASTPAYWNGSGTVHLTRSPQVVTMETSRTSKPDARLCAFQPDAAAADAEVGTITLSNTTSLTSECIVHDVSSYAMTRINATSFTSYEHEYVEDDPSYDGVSSLQAYCNTEDTCLGFTTFIYRDDDGTVEEHPLAILRAGNSDIEFEYPRMVYLKRTESEKTCTAVTQDSGKIEVWIEQTSSDDATVDVYVNGFYARTCGTRESPFASGVSGTSSNCGTYNLCYGGQTFPGAVVKVIPQSTYATASSQSACVGALHVLFRQTFVDVDAVVDTRPVYTPPASLATNFASTFPSSRLIELKYNVETVITVYVRNINRAALQLKQTGYDCNTTNDCPDSLVEYWLDEDGISDYLEDTVTDMNCGGASKFNGYDGLSNNCQTKYFCGEALGAGEETIFSGWIYIVPQISFIFEHSTLCKYFSGTLSMSKKDAYGTTVGNDRTLSYAPLLSTDSTFRMLIAADYNMEVDEVVSEYFNITDAIDVALLPLENLFLEDYALYAATLTKVRNHNLQPTMAQACVMDWISADAATCTFMVPAGSNFLALRVEQSTFAETKNFITTTFTARKKDSGKTATAATIYCGGSYGFSGDLAVDGECDTYLDCTRQFLYKSDTLMDTEPIESITISVPRTVSAGQPCYASAAIIAEFDYDDTEVPTDCDFLCSYSRECIPYAWVCDGVSDCPDGADEQGCTLFQIAEQDRHFNSTAVTVFTSTNFLGCIRRSLGIGSNYFAYQASLFTCTVYAAANGTTMGMAPLDYLINASGINLYHYATAPYKHCTSLNTCSGNGVLMVAANGACSCFCNNGFSGTSCSDLVSINNYAGIQVLFSSTLSASVPAIQADVGAALRYLTDSTISIACSSVFPLDAATIAVLCTGTMTGLSSVLTSSSALQLFNAQLKPEIDQAIGIGFYTVPGYNTLSTCAPSGATNSCPLPTATKLKGAVVAWNQPPGAASLSLDVTANAASRRLGSTTQTFTCGSTSSIGVSSQDGGCSSFSCLVPLGVEAVTSVSATAAVPATAECTPAVSSVSYAAGFTLSTVAQPASISNVDRDFTPFLAGGIVLLCLAVILVGVSFGFFCIDKNAVDELTREVRYSSLSGLHKLLRITFIRMGYYQDEVQFVRKERWSVALLVVAANFTIAGVFLVLYYLTGTGFSSDTSLGVEIYTSSLCEASATSSSPLGAFIIDGDESKTCAPRQVAGTSAASFAAGYCELIGGVAVAFVRVAKSEDVCKTLPYVRVTSGSCVAISTVIPSITTAQYVRVECGTKSNVLARFTDIQGIATSSTQSDSINTEMVGSDYYQYWRDSSLVSTVSGVTTYSFVAVRPSGLMTTTSALPVCLESHAPGSSDYDTASKARVLVQAPSEAFQPPTSSNYYKTTATVETTTYKDTDKIVATGFGPKDGDLPLGRIYNRFNTTTYNTGTAAAAASTHYYDVQYSRIDIGAWYGENTDAKDGDGFTISMYLKATRNALGFAFAVTDAYEDISSRSSPALDKAIDMLTRNSPPDVWFSNAYHIYSSLYVNGPASSLHFIHANPSTTADGNASSSDALSERFVDVKWDIAALGLEHLFNGLWHHVAVVLRSENSQTKAQLVVDGETSLSEAGWNQCMDRRPTKIFNISEGLSVPAYSASKERFMSGGMLYAGYFNGGIGHLRFRSEAVPTYTLWLETTTAIRQKNAIMTLKFTILGWGLIALGAVFFFIMVFSSGMKVWKDHKRGQAQLRYAARTSYDNVIARRKFPHEPLSLERARRWLGLTKDQLIIFLQELEASTGNPAQEVFRVLYMVRRAEIDDVPVDQGTPMPTLDEWKALLRDDTAKEESPTGILSALSFRKKSVVSDSHDADGGSSRPVVDLAPQILAVGNNNLMSNDIELASVSTEEVVDVSVLQEESKRKGGAEINVGGAGNTKMNNAGGDNKMLSGNSDAAALSLHSAVPPALKELASPVIMAVQSVYVWLSSIPFPRVYETYFQGLFSFISVDWAVAFTIPTIITPLIQFFGGMLVFAFLAYHSKMDEYRFAWYLARYTLKRDALRRKAQDKSSKPIDPEKPSSNGVVQDPLSYVGDVLAAIPYPFGNFTRTSYEYSISVLPVEACQAIDRFVGISKMPEKNVGEGGADNDEGEGDVHRLQEQEELTVCSAEGKPFVLRKPPVTKLKKTKLIPALTVESEESTLSIEPIGVCCREHPKRLLVPQVQTDIWPFVFPPSCCVVANGKRCGCTTGTIFVCGEHDPQEDGSVSVCDFAICERHIRHEPTDLIMSMALQLPRQVEQQGASWLLATIFLLLANAAYTPFMQTALMILACSPFYQCEFEKCWGSTMDQKFSLAVYLCLVIVVLLGVGLPLLQTLQLWRCRKMMELAFFAEEYDGAYEEREDEDEEMVAVSEARPLREVPATPTAAPAAPAKRRLKLDEWIRFTSSDPTVMGTLYKTLTFEWMFMSPIILAWKIIIIVPAVFLPADTFEQRVGIAAAQVAFSLFIFATSPFISPLVDAMYRLSCIHQVLFLGVESLSVVRQYEGNGEYGMALVLITMSYICTAVGGLLWGMVGPVVREFIIRKTSETVLASFGLHYSMTTSVFVVPDMATGIKRTERTAVEDNFEL